MEHKTFASNIDELRSILGRQLSLTIIEGDRYFYYADRWLYGTEFEHGVYILDSEPVHYAEVFTLNEDPVVAIVNTQDFLTEIGYEDNDNLSAAMVSMLLFLDDEPDGWACVIPYTQLLILAQPYPEGWSFSLLTTESPYWYAPSEHSYAAYFDYITDNIGG